MKFSELDNKRVACLITGARFIFCGRAEYDYESGLGSFLRVRPETNSSFWDQRNADMLIQEREWLGEIVRDKWYSCDYILAAKSSYSGSTM